LPRIRCGTPIFGLGASIPPGEGRAFCDGVEIESLSRAVVRSMAATSDTVGDSFQVVVIGAGAAGLLAATRSAERGRRTLLVEKNRKPGVKILMSGGTRQPMAFSPSAIAVHDDCNVTGQRRFDRRRYGFGNHRC